MSATETPLKLEHEQIIAELVPKLDELIKLVPASHRQNTLQMGNSILQNLHNAGVPTHVAGPVLAGALSQIMSAVLQRSQQLRAQGGRHPSDPKETDA